MLTCGLRCARREPWVQLNGGGLAAYRRVACRVAPITIIYSMAALFAVINGRRAACASGSGARHDIGAQAIGGIGNALMCTAKPGEQRSGGAMC